MPKYKSVKPGRKVTQLITVQELRQKIWDAINDPKWDEYDRYFGDNKPGKKAPKCLDGYVGYGFRSLTPQIQKDLSKVDYDEENIMCDGYHTTSPGGRILPNGLAIIPFGAGGDWESPVFYVVYWDGKKLRAYIPSNGNVYNRTTKQAYGNDEEKDGKDKKKVYGKEVNFDDNDELWCDYQPDEDWDMMIREIQERIVIDIP